MRRSSRLVLAALGSVCVGLAFGCAARTQSAPCHSRDDFAQATAEAHGAAGVEWLRIPLRTGGSLDAAVARPSGAGPHSVLVVLHGSHGFAREYVGLARDLAREAGVIAVATCWFSGRKGAGIRSVTPIEGPDAPPMPLTGATPEAAAVVGAVLDAARALPGARSDRIALLGHSRGAVASLFVALEQGGSGPRAANSIGPALHAIVLNSGAYPPELVARAADLEVPVLLLHGTADSAADGGSAMTTVERARDFEAALAAAGRRAEVGYFEGAQHNGLFADPAQRAASVRRIASFLRRHAAE